MSKWIRSLTLALTVAAGTAGFVVVGGPVAFGQAKAKDGKEAPKTDAKAKVDPAKPAEVKGSVVITKDKQMKFRFQVRDAADKVVMQSVKGYETEKDAIKAFEDALAIAKVAKPALEK